MAVKMVHLKLQELTYRQSRRECNTGWSMPVSCRRQQAYPTGRAQQQLRRPSCRKSVDTAIHRARRHVIPVTKAETMPRIHNALPRLLKPRTWPTASLEDHRSHPVLQMRK